MPQEARTYQPRVPVQLDRKIWADTLRTASKGSSASLSGTTFEMLQVALDDECTLELQAFVAEQYSRGKVPSCIAEALSLGRMVALRKDGGGVRGIVAGDAFRRVVGKALARQFGKEFDQATAPFQYALSTRAGTDCATHLIRAATDADPECTLVSIDGIGAFDHIQRARMVDKLLALPGASALIPYV